MINRETIRNQFRFDLGERLIALGERVLLLDLHVLFRFAITTVKEDVDGEEAITRLFGRAHDIDEGFDGFLGVALGQLAHLFERGWMTSGTGRTP